MSLTANVTDYPWLNPAQQAEVCDILCHYGLLKWSDAAEVMRLLEEEIPRKT